MRHAATEKHKKQRNNDHDETPQAAQPPPQLVRRLISGNSVLVVCVALKNACAVWSSGNTVCGERRGEGQERRFVRMYGAEKLQSFVAEVDDDAGRAGCFTERQPRRGLAGDGETPETSASKDPCERTPIANERAQVSSLHAQTHPRCSAPVARTIHPPLPRREGAQARKSDTFSCFFHRAPLPFWSERKGGFGLPLAVCVRTVVVCMRRGQRPIVNRVCLCVLSCTGRIRPGAGCRAR